MVSKISPSIMCVDYINLFESIKELEKANVEYLHFDIMDGDFVPNYALGTDFMKKVRGITNIPFDIHLMINYPEKKLSYFDIKEGDLVCVHQESTLHLQRVLKNIKDLGAKAGVALNPATSFYNIEDVLVDIDVILIMSVNPGYAGKKLVPAMLDKINRLKKYITNKKYLDIEIEVDGNVSYENAQKMQQAGADIFVAGTSSIFNGEEDIESSIKKFREILSANKIEK